jgi:hypothetical protein
MHKKKNSESVLAGEMIITFYKPAKAVKKRKPSSQSPHGESVDVLSEVFEACLSNGNTSFTSEALFNRLIIEMWQRRALDCLAMDRREFAGRLRQRGWSYNTHTHLWTKGRETSDGQKQPELFDTLRS